MKIHKYFISYRYLGIDGWGFGRCEIISTPIKSIKDIQEIENILLKQRREQGYDRLIVMNFQRMEK